ncbi:FAD-binding domain-containing protein [Xylariaceae sp. FL0255]|nr:FAD-binding domain-containing protein [Xylariaceae sp. FL0255]
MRAAIYLSSLSAFFTNSYASSESCKAFPGTASWPREHTWARFNESTGGKLIKPTPPGAVCHPGEPTYNADECAAVRTAWYTYDFHQRDPISNMWQQYNNDTCLVEPDTPCSPAGYPAYVVNATCAEDVKLSLEFAHEHNIRVIVKSTGHDYQGRSAAPGSLSIWIRHMQGPLKTLKSFRPKGCDFTIDTTAVTAAGGTQMGQLYDDLDLINQTVVGGGSKSVSVGGYITGGGHSILSPHYGLAADQVLEIELVTPQGEILTANECQNEDLFWAMRGGGGSTFGVMTSITLKTYPTPKIVGGIAAVATEVGAPFLWDMVGYVVSQSPYLLDKGVSGYMFTTTNQSLPVGNSTINVAGVGGSVIIIGTQELSDLDAIWEPIFTYANKTWGAFPYTSFAAYPSFKAWYDVYYDQNPAGYDMWVGSHLLDEAAFGNATTLGEVYKISEATAYLVGGKGVMDAKPSGGSNAVNPSWRRTLVHATNGLAFEPLNKTARDESLANVNAITEPLRQLAPDMGAYVNENNPAEPNWQESFWGSNYVRLLQIKRRVDPHDVLWCHPCVGNERWAVQEDYRLCPSGRYYPGAKQSRLT